MDTAPRESINQLTIELDQANARAAAAEQAAADLRDAITVTALAAALRKVTAIHTTRPEHAVTLGLAIHPETLAAEILNALGLKPSREETAAAFRAAKRSGTK